MGVDLGAGICPVMGLPVGNDKKSGQAANQYVSLYCSEATPRAVPAASLRFFRSFGAIPGVVLAPSLTAASGNGGHSTTTPAFQ